LTKYAHSVSGGFRLPDCLEEIAIVTATVPTIRRPAEGDSGIGERIGK
jgi:hypothetical protein